MNETITIPSGRLAYLEERIRKLAGEKSEMQLIIHLMNRISALPGLDNMIDNMLQSIVEVVGGDNLILYYRIDDELLYADLLGVRKRLELIEDGTVLRVFTSGEPEEVRSSFSETHMLTSEFSAAFTWVFPLTVGQERVGVFKLVNLHISMQEMYPQFPAFFRYVALVLKNEIQGHSRLQQAYDRLSDINAELEMEIDERQRAEQSLLTVRDQLEDTVRERTAELSAANAQLQQELAERKQAEQALRKSETMLREAQRVAHIGCWELDLCSNRLTWSDEVFRIFELDPQQFSASYEAFLNAIHPEDREAVDRAYSDSLVTRAAYSIHHRLLMPDGRIKYVHEECASEFDADGAPLRSVGTVQDVTERKQAENEVRRLKNYLANIIDSMPSLLVGLDSDGRITQWNRQAETSTGIAMAFAVGRRFTELAPDFTPWIEQLRSEIEQRRPASLEKLLIEKEGERRFYDLMLYPLIANGVEGTVVRIEDVTERTHIQELMIQTEKMMSVGGLAAGMAHEINNPLGIITQAAQNIERRVLPDLPANQAAAAEAGVSLEHLGIYFEQRQIHQFIASIREAAARASRIITNILRFSRRTEMTVQSARLPEIMEQALELAANDYDLKKKYDFRSIVIIRDYQPDMPELPVAPTEIEQVLLNLLKNAAQAMITNPAERKPCITLRISKQERYAMIKVEDNGPGMTEEIRRRVFEPFFTTKEPGIGTGLGLSVSYMIVTQNHKGMMEVSSAPGSGARFTVKLPLNCES